MSVPSPGAFPEPRHFWNELGFSLLFRRYYYSLPPKDSLLVDPAENSCWNVDFDSWNDFEKKKK